MDCANPEGYIGESLQLSIYINTITFKTLIIMKFLLLSIALLSCCVSANAQLKTYSGSFKIGEDRVNGIFGLGRTGSDNTLIKQ